MIERLDAESPEVQRFLDQLRALPETTEPRPSPELEALLTGAEVVVPIRPRRRARGWMVAVVAAVALVVVATGTGFAAAANTLPGPLQDAIADLSDHHYLPFDVPHSTDGGRGGVPGLEKNGLPVDKQTPRGPRGRIVGPQATPSAGPDDDPSVEESITGDPTEEPAATEPATPTESAQPGSEGPTTAPSTEPPASSEPSDDGSDEDQGADETDGSAPDQGRPDEAPVEVQRGKADPPGHVR